MAEITDVAAPAAAEATANAEAPEHPAAASHSTGVSTQSSKVAEGQPATASAEDATELPADVAAAVVKQVEFYFSDANLPTDEFLLKQVKKSHHGWVNLHVIARFARMKLLTSSVPGIANALRKSEALVVSADGQAVKRKNPLPHVDTVDVAERTVVAENLPPGHVSIDALTKLFSQCGVVKLVRVCHPGEVKSVAQAETGDKNNKHPAHDIIVSNQLHALVEYTTVDEADSACKQLTDDQNWRSGLKVRHLLRGHHHAHHPSHHHHGDGSNSDGGKEHPGKPHTKGHGAGHHHGKEHGHGEAASKEHPAASEPSAKPPKPAAPERVGSGTIGDDVMAEAIAMARMATQAASHNSEVVKSRRRSTEGRRSLEARRSMEARRSLDHVAGGRPTRHSIDVPSSHAHEKTRERRDRSNLSHGSTLSSDFFATATTTPAPQAADHHVVAIKTAARQLQEEVVSTDSGGETSSGGEEGGAHGKKKNKKKTKAEYAKWASGAAAAAASGHHHDHHGVHQPVMPDGTRGFSMGRGKPMAPPPS